MAEEMTLPPAPPPSGAYIVNPAPEHRSRSRWGAFLAGIVVGALVVMVAGATAYLTDDAPERAYSDEQACRYVHQAIAESNAGGSLQNSVGLMARARKQAQPGGRVAQALAEVQRVVEKGNAATDAEFQTTGAALAGACLSAGVSLGA